MWAVIQEKIHSLKKPKMVLSSGVGKKRVNCHYSRTKGNRDPERRAVGEWGLINIFGLWWRDATDLRLPAKKEPSCTPLQSPTCASHLLNQTRSQKVQGKVEKDGR